jgi:transcriptional regulator of arginine metabolism
MNKSYRQGQILKLIGSRRIQTQEELALALREIGVPATQVTLSRDIRDMRLAKTSEGYRQVGSQPSGPALELLASEFVLDIRQAQNLLVLKTSPGHANSVAVALDHESWPEVVGTIAGDDTILVILPDTATADAIRSRLWGMLDLDSTAEAQRTQREGT